MSTQVIETNLEVMKGDLVEYISDENLDILDEFEADLIADLWNKRDFDGIKALFS